MMGNARGTVNVLVAGVSNMGIKQVRYIIFVITIASWLPAPYLKGRTFDLSRLELNSSWSPIAKRAYFEPYDYLPDQQFVFEHFDKPEEDRPKKIKDLEDMYYSINI